MSKRAGLEAVFQVDPYFYANRGDPLTSCNDSQVFDEALLGLSPSLIPFEDACVLKHVREHHANFSLQDFQGVLLVEPCAVPREDPYRPGSMRRA